MREQIQEKLDNVNNIDSWFYNKQTFVTSGIAELSKATSKYLIQASKTFHIFLLIRLYMKITMLNQ